MSDHSPIEVLVTPGRCVIWHCGNAAAAGKPACDEHAAGLTLEQAPCSHGVRGRCRRCWEASDPLLLEAQRTHERDRKRRNRAAFRARQRAARLEAMTVN